MQRIHKTRGTALISAIFITALAAMIATALAVESELTIHDATYVMNGDAAYLALQYGEAIAKSAVKDYVMQWSIGSQQPVTAEIKALPMKLPTIMIDGLPVKITLENAQGKFNLNDLVYSQNQQNFVILLRTVVPTLHSEEASAIAGSITAWMLTGSDNPYYAAQQLPYKSSKNQFTSVTELRLIRGVTPSIYQALLPYVTVIPIQMPKETINDSQQEAQLTPIDFNAAEAPVLMAINPGLTITQAQGLVDCRKTQGAFLNTQDFINQCVTPSGVTNLTEVTAQSRYFDVHIETTVNHTTVCINSLIMTSITKNNTLKLIKIWQAFE